MYNKTKKYLNQYHVIQLDIAELKVTMPEGEELVAFLQKCVLEELRKVYPDAGKDTPSLPLALADINENYEPCLSDRYSSDQEI